MNVSGLNLAGDLRKIRRLEEARRWRLRRPAPLEIWVAMSPSAAPTETFWGRLLWAVYPGSAPSLKFRDEATGRLDVLSAWPVLPGFRAGNFDYCVNWCAEGLAAHTEWTTDARYRWDPKGNVLLRTLRILQEELDEHYGGRAA